MPAPTTAVAGSRLVASRQASWVAWDPEAELSLAGEGLEQALVRVLHPLAELACSQVSGQVVLGRLETNQSESEALEV